MDIKTQDPKYNIIDGALANAVTREFIPDDEPLFFLRGKDEKAIQALWCYYSMCADPTHRTAIRMRINAFEAFKKANPDRMNEPDTDGADQWPDHA